MLYEDEFLAVDQQAARHGGPSRQGALERHAGQRSAVPLRPPQHLNGDYRPGIVHRLDRDTSGVILVAKEEQTHRDLSMQFEMRKIFKEYVAITAGVLDRDSDYIEGRIGHHPHDRVKMTVIGRRGRRQGRVQLLRGDRALPRLHLLPVQSADGADAPDPRSPGERRLSGAGGQGLQRPRQGFIIRPD